MYIYIYIYIYVYMYIYIYIFIHLNIYIHFVFTSKSAQSVEEYNSILTIEKVVTTSELYYSEFHVVKQSSGIRCSSFLKKIKDLLYSLQTYKTLHQSMSSFLVTVLIKYLL